MANPWPRSSDWNPPRVCCKGRIGSVAQPGMKPGLPSTVKGYWFLFTPVHVDFNDRRYFQFGFAFSVLSGLKLCWLKAVTHRELWKTQCWAGTAVTPPGSLCAAAAQVRAVQNTSGVTPAISFADWTFICLIIDLWLKPRAPSVNSRKVVSARAGEWEVCVLMCLINVPLITEVLFSAQCPHDLDMTTRVTCL